MNTKRFISVHLRSSAAMIICEFAEAGPPLDNNICERALKRAVLHRKNALFYRTLHGMQADKHDSH